MEDTPADQLSTKRLRHTELIRIDRDFGKEHFDIVLDGWTTRTGSPAIVDVRLWWLKMHENEERGPFSARSARHFDIEYDPVSKKRWMVRMKSGGKTFEFQVKLDDRDLVAYATVVGPESAPIEHCRAHEGDLIARRILGVPAGIDELRIRCTTPEGRTIVASVRASED